MEREKTFRCSNCRRYFPSNIYLLCHCNLENISCYFKEGKTVLPSDFKCFSLYNVFSSTSYTAKEPPSLPENLTGIVYTEECVMNITPYRWSDEVSDFKRFSYDDTVRPDDSISMVSARSSTAGSSVH